MTSRRIKVVLSGLPKADLFGFRTNESGYFIGNTPVSFDGDNLLLADEKYVLTDGLLGLLSQQLPEGYSNRDLEHYKEILLLTSAHRRNFNQKQHICSSKSWKYKNVISKLFPPKRVYERTKKQNSLTKTYLPKKEQEIFTYFDYKDDPNLLVERFKALEELTDTHNNIAEIRAILKELERLGIIEFY